MHPAVLRLSSSGWIYKIGGAALSSLFRISPSLRVGQAESSQATFSLQPQPPIFSSHPTKCMSLFGTMPARKKLAREVRSVVRVSNSPSSPSVHSTPTDMKYALRHLRVLAGAMGVVLFYSPRSFLRRGASVRTLPVLSVPPSVCAPRAQMCAAAAARHFFLCGAEACNRQHLCASLHPSTR